MFRGGYREKLGLVTIRPQVVHASEASDTSGASFNQLGGLGGAVSPPNGVGAEPRKIFEIQPFLTPETLKNEPFKCKYRARKLNPVVSFAEKILQTGQQVNKEYIQFLCHKVVEPLSHLNS